MFLNVVAEILPPNYTAYHYCYLHWRTVVVCELYCAVRYDRSFVAAAVVAYLPVVVVAVVVVEQMIVAALGDDVMEAAVVIAVDGHLYNRKQNRPDPKSKQDLNGHQLGE